MIEQRVGSSIEQHDYDALGRRIRTRNDLGQFDYTYLGQTEQMVSARLLGTPIGRDLIYEANAGDRRLYRLSHHGGGAPSYTYASAPEQLIDGIVETVEGQSALWAYDYDAAGRLKVADRSDGAQYDYAYDAADNVSHIEAPGGSQVFAHDVTNRIAQTGYVYDANGNRLEDPIRVYQWDAENRLIGVSHKSSPGRSSHFVYDGLGRRSVIEERAGLVTVGETRYAWCGQTLCQARNGSDVELRHYFEEGEHWRLQGSRLVYVRDHLGSVRGLVRAGDGALMGAHDYDPYGRLISVSGLYPREFGYAGMHHHVSSGLWLTRYRAYDSQTARWLSRDPIEEEGASICMGMSMGIRSAMRTRWGSIRC